MLNSFEKKNKPLVSIVVPVYNSEKFVRECIDSLVHQSLENIEIIAVDDGSTDRSLSILEEYQKNYPNKVIVKSIPHVHGAGAPRNEAIKIARGDYLAFCDSDDIMDRQAVELLYKKAIENDHDIVCAPIWIYTGNTKSLYGVLKEPISTESLILTGQLYLHTKLVHKRLIQKAGWIPEEISMEDLGYSLVLHSYATRIGYLDYPVYHYFKRYGSDSNAVFGLRNLDTIKARQYAIENCNPQFRQYVLAYVARHIHSDFRKRWSFTDYYIKQLKELWPELKDNPVLNSDEYLYKRLESFVSLPDKPIPCKVWVGGFGEKISEEFLQDCRLNAFYEGCKVIVLNEQNCNISENKLVKAAYDAGEYDFVNGYFALKAIWSEGGIYLNKRIKIDTPFNYIRYCNVFFSLIDNNQYSDWVFGGMAGNPIMETILESYKDSRVNKLVFHPLSSRIKDALDGETIDCSHVNNILNPIVTVFSPDVMVCDLTDKHSLQPEPHICTHDFSEKSSEIDYITLRKSTLRALVQIPGANDELNEVKKENAMLRNKIRNLELSATKEL
ncbi:glycosyltransferase [Brevibacillus sp. 179-C9.3 HS]|uniref:glycosyltransferase n=1 Tax=unclassified Brevibacillus TaxID=2684853 RepID=UPI0039A33FC9